MKVHQLLNARYGIEQNSISWLASVFRRHVRHQKAEHFEVVIRHSNEISNGMKLLNVYHICTYITFHILPKVTAVNSKNRK